VTIEIVGITGLAGSGKDTVAARFVEGGFVRAGLADALKADLLVIDPPILGWSDLSQMVESWGWDFVKREYPEVRRMLQAHGGLMRDVAGDEFWLRRAEKTMGAFPGAKRFVVPDIRYDNEAHWCDVLIEVVRPGAGLPGELGRHPTEQGVTRPPDFTINNHSTIPDLHFKVDLILQRLDER
jgi:hypothetical protein